MSTIIELQIKNSQEIYCELTKVLSPYKEEPQGSIIFIVEGTKKSPIIGIRYPGKKVKKRALKIIRVNSALWANPYDFEVVPFSNGKQLNTRKFTFTAMLKDFEEHKIDNKEFWYAIEELYKNNIVPDQLPQLPGIHPRFYLFILKWLWIQEDFNYKFTWEETGSPIRYVLETRTGNRTTRGAGRGKFFAALLLLKTHFNFEEVKKIIPLY